MSVITRFAPSPTGALHIGGARTALFNWLYSKNKKGLFKLRIEDTDIERSKKEFTDQICSSMKWLGLDWDEDIIYQSNNKQQHIDIANELLSNGKAYKCYCTKAELELERQNAIANKLPYKYSGKYRNFKGNRDAEYVIRIKVPENINETFNDDILGKISLDLNNIEDFIIVRSDGSPTYMLSAVVDDYNMNVTNVIRGDDHLTNTFKQIIIYKLMNWKLPKFGHVPLIHGSDGAKLSKRHGALSVLRYKELGYLSEAFNNYLMRLGWGHKNQEIFSIPQAVSLFDISNIGKSPARFDIAKLNYLNSHYIKNIDYAQLISFSSFKKLFNSSNKDMVNKLVLLYRESMENLNVLQEGLNYVINYNTENRTQFAIDIIIKTNQDIKDTIIKDFNELEDWDSKSIQNLVKNISLRFNVKVFDIAAPIRAAITGQQFTPNIFKILEILGKEITLQRLKKSFSN